MGEVTVSLPKDYADARGLPRELRGRVPNAAARADVHTSNAAQCDPPLAGPWLMIALDDSPLYGGRAGWAIWFPVAWVRGGATLKTVTPPRTMTA